MSHRISLTLACGDYEITRALREGTVKPAGIDLTIIDNLDSATRHWRFLRNREFDMAETSSCSYVMAREAGMAVQAIPVFLHRRFRHGFVFINSGKGIRKPSDLTGRKIGCKEFTVSAVHWMRGILEHEYGLPHNSMEWVTELDEDVDFTPPPGLRITRLPDDRDLEQMLLEGEIDALISPDLIESLRRGDPRVARLFPDYKAEEIAYYRKTGIFPIMHVMGVKPEVVEKFPWVAISMYDAFEESKAIAMKRMENPRIVPLAWYREAWEEQQALLGPDPWEYGLSEINKKNYDLLAQFVFEQGMTRRRMTLQDLFAKEAFELELPLPVKHPVEYDF